MQLHAIYCLENLEGTLKGRRADTNRWKFVNGKFERALAMAGGAEGKRIFRHVSARIFSCFVELAKAAACLKRKRSR